MTHDTIIRDLLREQADRIAYLEDAVEARDARQRVIDVNGLSWGKCVYCGALNGWQCDESCPKVTHPMEGKP